jgi:hypothetical protein
MESRGFWWLFMDFGAIAFIAVRLLISGEECVGVKLV